MTDWGRDGDLWPVLLDTLRRRSLRAPATVWSAGCATGEEPYTLAMRTACWPHPRRIVATDVHREALAVARGGRYPAATCCPPNLSDLTQPEFVMGDLIRPNQSSALRLSCKRRRRSDRAVVHCPRGR
ncbi:CheR family methyltransferase [Micromonospora sp. NPDC047465]|uniref:CheR family methyltransferase n=1 Tax=Micromonospora sp. NPDC047465 TaxID=3154813 RepID=UPI0033C045D0